MPKILVYDGDCPMCGWISRRFGELGLADDENRRPYQSFEGDLAQRLEGAGIRNEMLVLDTESGELRAGIDGFLWLLSDSRWGGLAGALSLAPARALMRLVYRTIAYNRRVLAPPPRGIVCACDPDPHAGFRTLFIVGLAVFNLVGVGLLGLAVSNAFDGPGALPVAVLAVLAALATLLMLRVSLPLDPFVLLGNTFMVLAAGTLVAAPGLALSLAFEGAVSRILVAASVGVGVWRGLRSARIRLLRPATGSASVRLTPDG